MATFVEYFNQTISSMLTSYLPPGFIVFHQVFIFSITQKLPYARTYVRMPGYAPDNSSACVND